jgi:hypothetical protein
MAHPGQPTHMTPKITPLLILILFALAIGPGCTAPTAPTGGGGPLGGTQAPPGTQVSGSGSVPTPIPGPVVTVPPIYDVQIQVNKNMIFTNPDITVFFRGGKGQYIIRKMFVQVFRSDGTYESGQLEHAAGEFRTDESVTVQGTTGTDRVIVTVTILGTEYKIYDQSLEFKTRP